MTRRPGGFRGRGSSGLVGRIAVEMTTVAALPQIGGVVTHVHRGTERFEGAQAGRVAGIGAGHLDAAPEHHAGDGGHAGTARGR